MFRPDISDDLIHFTGPREDWEAAYARLKSILDQRRIVAGNGTIRGGHSCVCFTEAPLLSLSGGLVNPSNYSRYSPFGVMFKKAWLFRLGCRPVIYHSDPEYLDLPPSHQWRHVRYEPDSANPIDFTWEREWRIQCPYLSFQPNDVALILPNGTWAGRLETEHDAEQDYMVDFYSQGIERFFAEQYRDDFPWRVFTFE